MISDDIEHVWKTFWEQIVTKPGYGVSLNEVKKELYDYYQLLQNVPKVYMEVTGGNISSPFVDPDVVISLFEDHVNDIVKTTIAETFESEEEELLP